MKIGMIAAMKSELEAALEKFGEPIRKEEYKGFEISVYSVSPNGQAPNEIYVTRSGAGEIYAAGATQMLIDRYGAEAIVNYGVVGGLTDDMKITRTVVVDKIVHYDFDVSFIDNCEPGRYVNYPDIYLETDRSLLEAALKAVPTLEKVICASGDKFIADPEKKRELNRKYGAKICEMESAGIFLTADRAGVPVLMIKAVSDSVSGGADEFVCMVREAAEECVRATLAALAGVGGKNA